MARKAASKPAESAANPGFAQKLWLAADKLRNNMVALPGQLLYSTQIPVCLWFNGKNESAGKCRAVSALGPALAA